MTNDPLKPPYGLNGLIYDPKHIENPLWACMNFCGVTISLSLRIIHHLIKTKQAKNKRKELKSHLWLLKA